MVNLQRDLIQLQIQLLRVLLLRARRRRRRAVWIREWIMRRPLYGQFSTLMVELAQEDISAYKNFLRMDEGMFQELLNRVGPRITKKTTWWRQPISPGLKLALTLRYLATGDSYQSMQYNFRVADNTIALFIPEVCKAIIDEYQEEVLKCPSTPEEWLAVEQEFFRKGAFPHVVGCIDGKHVAIQKPVKSGSLYFNYKKFFSIVLLALVDSDLKFLWVDIGSNGACSDAQIFNDSDLKQGLENDTLGFPPPIPIPGEQQDLPYYILADDAFALKPWMLKPYSKKNPTREEAAFNKRLSRVRMFVEHAFGVLANRFRCLLTTMRQGPQTVTTIVFACVILHNIMRIRYPQEHNRQQQEPGDGQPPPPPANLPDIDIQHNAREPKIREPTSHNISTHPRDSNHGSTCEEPTTLSSKTHPNFTALLRATLIFQKQKKNC